MQLENDVSETYFALLHVLVDVCGNRAMRECEEAVHIWLTRAGMGVVESSAESFNDSLASLLHRSTWWHMKLQLANTLLLTRFDKQEVRDQQLVLDPQKAFSMSHAGERLLKCYFHLRPVASKRGTPSPTESSEFRFDPESLVILVATAWQCAGRMRDEFPELWGYLTENKQAVEQAFGVFEGKITRLSSMRDGKNAARVSMYMSLLKALISTL